MNYMLEEDAKNDYISAASFNSEQENESNSSLSLAPPPLYFAGEGIKSISSDGNEHDYAADYQRLLNDDISFVHESNLYRAMHTVHLEKHGDYWTYVNNQTGEPWFVGKKGEQYYQPYTKGYRDIVMPKENLEQHNYIQFNSAKVQLTSEGGLVSVDTGGTTTINGDKVSFDFNIASGDFSMSTDLLPVGKISGNIWEKNLGLDAEFEAQLGIIKFEEDYSFEIELCIPGLPYSPAIILGGKLNQQLIKSDWEHLITRKFFPFIGRILDALDNPI